MNFTAGISGLIGLFIANYIVDFVGEINIVFSGVVSQAVVFLTFAYVK